MGDIFLKKRELTSKIQDLDKMKEDIGLSLEECDQRSSLKVHLAEIIS